MSVIHLTTDNFDEITAEGVTLVDFWATWCGPCKMIAPAIESLAETYEGKANICKIDIDTQQDLAVRFGIMSIPTILIFANGEEVAKHVGATSEEALAEMLDRAIASIAESDCHDNEACCCDSENTCACKEDGCSC